MVDPIGHVILEQRSHDSPWSEVDRKPYHGGDLTSDGLDLSKLTKRMWRFRLDTPEGVAITYTMKITSPPSEGKGD